MSGSRRLNKQYLLLMIVLVSCRWLPAIAQRQGAKNEAASAESRPAKLVPGRQDFESRCSGCHGLDGRGGERGPNISTNPAVQRLADREMFRIVHDGIPTKGMPSFDFLAATEIKSLVNYLRSLGSGPSQQPLRGNPVRGKELFFGKAECSSCHMIGGKGGFLGSDLTGYSRSRAPDEVRQGILNPGRSHQQGVEVVTRSGERFSGIVRNEDNFSLQVLGTDGAFHMLMKSEVEHLTRRPGPVMPEDYGQRLSSGDLDDLVSYLAQSARIGSADPDGASGAVRKE